MVLASFILFNPVISFIGTYGYILNSDQKCSQKVLYRSVCFSMHLRPGHSPAPEEWNMDGTLKHGVFCNHQNHVIEDTDSDHPRVSAFLFTRNHNGDKMSHGDFCENMGLCVDQP